VGISVFSLKAALVTGLAALIPTNADYVIGGLPAQVPPLNKPRRVYVLDVLHDEPLPVFVPGSQMRREDYIVPIALEVLNFTGRDVSGYAQTLAKMGTLVAAIETICAADPSWGGVVMQSGLALAKETTGVYGDQGGTGWCSHVLLELHVLRQGA